MASVDPGYKGAVAHECQAELRNEVLRIEAALTRADEGTFGLCTRCSVPIDDERLADDPAMPFCIDCISEVRRRVRGTRKRG